MNIFGKLGCLLCVTGSLVIVLHAPEERPVFSVSEIWMLASRPGEPLSSPECNRSSREAALLDSQATCSNRLQPAVYSTPSDCSFFGIRGRCSDCHLGADLGGTTKIGHNQYICVHRHLLHCGIVIGHQLQSMCRLIIGVASFSPPLLVSLLRVLYIFTLYLSHSCACCVPP